MILVSDIHFGSGAISERATRQALEAAVRSDRVLIVPGDFTQHAREDEYQSARTFLENALGAGVRVICTPGNHDYGRWLGEKFADDSARDRYLKQIFSLVADQDCVVEARDVDTITVLGDDVFVTLRSTHAHATKPNRITGQQLDWAASWLKRHRTTIRRLHLVTHRSLWGDLGTEDHAHLNRRDRLEKQLLAEFDFETFVHGHNHRFVFERRTTPKRNHPIYHLGAPTCSSRTRECEPGLIEWSPADGRAGFRLLR